MSSFITLLKYLFDILHIMLGLISKLRDIFLLFYSFFISLLRLVEYDVPLYNNDSLSIFKSRNFYNICRNNQGEPIVVSHTPDGGRKSKVFFLYMYIYTLNMLTKKRYQFKTLFPEPRLWNSPCSNLHTMEKSHNIVTLLDHRIKKSNGLDGTAAVFY